MTEFVTLRETENLCKKILSLFFVSQNLLNKVASFDGRFPIFKAAVPEGFQFLLTLPPREPFVRDPHYTSWMFGRGFPLAANISAFLSRCLETGLYAKVGEASISVTNSSNGLNFIKKRAKNGRFLSKKNGRKNGHFLFFFYVHPIP